MTISREMAQKFWDVHAVECRRQRRIPRVKWKDFRDASLGRKSQVAGQ